MALTFTQQLREGYLQLVRSLPKEERVLVEWVRQSLARSCPSGERADRLLALVRAYRSGPRERWGPVLLDVLAPGLLACRKRLRRERPLMAEDDVRQHLVLELLVAAAQMPLPQNSAYLSRRLLSRASQNVVRVLARERRRQARQWSLDWMLEKDEAMAGWPGWTKWKSMVPHQGI